MPVDGFSNVDDGNECGQFTLGRRAFLKATGTTVAWGSAVVLFGGLPETRPAFAAARLGSSSAERTLDVAQAAVGDIVLGGANVRPPSVPLAVRSPYLSTWLPATELTGVIPQFWYGSNRGFAGLIRIDGQLCAWAALPQINGGATTPLTQSPPATLDQCRQDLTWRAMLLLSLQDEFSTENLEFLDAVDSLRARQPDAQLARQIYDQFVSDTAPTQVNLYSGNHDALRVAFAANPAPDRVDQAFEAAYAEIYGLVRDDKYGKFMTTANGVRRELEEETAVRIDTPAAVQFTADQINSKVVDQWNERALKGLPQGQTTGFYQVGDLLLLVHPQGRQGGQPYLDWAQDQDGDVEGTVTMTKKGGAFNPGSVKVAGVQDRAIFEAAVARVSKKEVLFD